MTIGASNRAGGDGSERVVPQHIAFIMDGNGRWAEARGLARAHGHERGAETLRAITRRCSELGVSEITCYALSTENLRRRPPDEVRDLMGLLSHYLKSDRADIDELEIQLKFIGRRGELPPDTQDELIDAERSTSHHRGMILRLAINYGSRSELADAARSLAERAVRGEIDPSAIDEEAFAAALDDPAMPDPDLLIRTAGEERVSNFLLWQISYAELYFARCPWPDFGPERLEEAIEAYAQRRRKYGAITPPTLTPKEEPQA